MKLYIYLKPIKFFLLTLLLTLGLKAVAQYDQTLYYMSGIPQFMRTNPAFAPKASLFVGFPFLTSINVKAGHSGFAFSDMATQTKGDSMKVTPGNAINLLKKYNNYLSLDFQWDLLAFGFKVKNFYFNFNYSNKEAVRINYPKDLFTMMWQGNAGFIGQDASFNGIGVNAISYNELGMGVSYKVNKKLRVGAKVKLLNGLANVQFAQTNLALNTNSHMYEQTGTADILVNSSYVDPTTASPSVIFNGPNKGFALDLGANYQINYKWSVNASIIDWGSITWNSNVKNYYTEHSTFTFEGLDINSLITGTNSDPLKPVLDTLSKVFKIKDKSVSYKTNLPMRIYVGSLYNLTYKDKVGILYHGDVFDSQLNSSITLSYNRMFGNFFNLGLSYSILNGTYNNLGLGFGLNLGSFQIYAITDNLMSPFYWYNSKNVSAQFGINFLFGYKDKRIKDQSLID